MNLKEPSPSIKNSAVIYHGSSCGNFPKRRESDETIRIGRYMFEKDVIYYHSVSIEIGTTAIIHFLYFLHIHLGLSFRQETIESKARSRSRFRLLSKGRRSLGTDRMAKTDIFTVNFFARLLKRIRRIFLLPSAQIDDTLAVLSLLS